MVNSEKVRVLKLVDGETIYAEVEYTSLTGLDHGKSALKLTNPVVLHVLEDGGATESVKVGFRDWCPMVAKPECTLLREHVLFCEVPARDFLAIYEEHFNTIKIPGQSGLYTGG